MFIFLVVDESLGAVNKYFISWARLRLKFPPSPNILYDFFLSGTLISLISRELECRRQILGIKLVPGEVPHACKL